MDSILHDGKNCYLCGSPGRWNDPLDWHHIYGKSDRKKSEKYGLKVRLCHNSCHIFGNKSAHKCRQTSDYLKAKGQIAFEKNYPDLNFFEIFGKNYK